MAAAVIIPFWLASALSRFSFPSEMDMRNLRHRLSHPTAWGMGTGGHRGARCAGSARMSGRSGKRITAKKPPSTTRTSAQTDGAFGRETGDNVTPERNRNRDRATIRKQDGA